MSLPGLPPVDPAYLAAVTEALPARIQRKVGTLASDDWTISGTVVSLGSATVTLPTGPVSAESPGSCDCLLSPKCLHLVSVLLACPLADAAEPAPAGGEKERDTPPAEPEIETAEQRLTEGAAGVLDLAEAALDVLVSEGLGALTAPLRGSVLRVVALARVHKLHTLAAAFATLHSRLSEDPRTAGSIAALGYAAEVTQRLRHHHNTGRIDPDDLGTARRRYAPAGTLRLAGLAGEPIRTDSGYAGVVTWLVSDTRPPRVYQLPAVQPGSTDDIRAAYRQSSGLPELSTDARTIARAGLLISAATASADGRLGKGAGVRASLRTAPAVAEPEGWWLGSAVIADLVDSTPPTLWLETTDGPKRVGLAAPVWELDPTILRVLAGCAGAEVEVRLRRERAGWTLLAIRCDTWVGVPEPGGWVFPGLDRITRNDVAHVWSGDPEAVAETVRVGPAEVVARWRDRVARLGRRAVTAAGPTLERDIAWLEANASPHRARALRELQEAAAAGSRRFDGTFAPDPHRVRPAWTALVLVG